MFRKLQPVNSMKKKRQKRKLAHLLRSKQVRSRGRVFARIGNLISLSLFRRLLRLTDALLESADTLLESADTLQLILLFMYFLVHGACETT